MRSGQRVSGVLEVVKLRAEPTVHGVAGFATCGKPEALVVDDGRQKILLMAGVASSRQALELPGGSAFVALIAFHQGVRPDKRKAILVIANRIQRNVPTLDRVATFTIRAKLPAMNVGMAIGAAGTCVLEAQAGMALSAGYLQVHAPQWIARTLMIKLGVRSDRLPTGIAVAILARDGQRAMRVGHLGLWTADTRARVVLRSHAHQ